MPKPVNTNDQSALPDSYLTLADNGHSEIRVQRSRFIAISAPAANEEQARAVIDNMAKKYHDCRHVCYGWRFGCGPIYNEARNDSGEPSGSAGEPILGAIRKTGLSDCIAVVVRYFGGVKLGTGGLGRAYGQAASEALANAPQKEILLGLKFSLTFNYAQQKTITKILAAHRGKTIAEEYTDKVLWRIWLPHSTWSNFGAVLKDTTAGTVEILAEEQ